MPKKPLKTKKNAKLSPTFRPIRKLNKAYRKENLLTLSGKAKYVSKQINSTNSAIIK